jgi:hypothetical protein
MEPTRKHRRDDEILADARRKLLDEPLLGCCYVAPDGEGARARAAGLFPEGFAGTIAVHVDDGVVILKGEVPSPVEKRLAEETVRRVQGCRRLQSGLVTTATKRRS